MKSKELIVTKEINGEIISLPLSMMKQLEEQLKNGKILTEQQEQEKTQQIIDHLESLVKEFNLKK